MENDEGMRINIEIRDKTAEVNATKEDRRLQATSIVEKTRNPEKQRRTTGYVVTAEPQNMLISVTNAQQSEKHAITARNRDIFTKCVWPK